MLTCYQVGVFEGLYVNKYTRNPVEGQFGGDALGNMEGGIELKNSIAFNSWL